jgi:hypothetical protein
MKKLVLSLILMIACITVNAQETEKKKDTNAPSESQERAINENGVSVKQPKKTTKAKVIPPPPPAPAPEEKKEEKPDAKKPE